MTIAATNRHFVNASVAVGIGLGFLIAAGWLTLVAALVRSRQHR